jgi:nucleotidyltransferase substrate binding protein (TIGR01987 family)
LFTSEKAELSVKKFLRALGRLEEAVTSPPSPLQSDAVLQRFEFTFELCWKALRIHLSETHGIEISSPKGTLKEAFRHGLIQDEQEKPALQMLDDRNRSTHVYDEPEAMEIFSRVCSAHLPLLKSLLASLMKERSNYP